MANDADLLPVLKSKACEIGADAVVITSDKSQHEGDQLVGWDDKVGSTVASKNANVSQRMHDPTVGEVGHKGHYLSGVAIAFTKGGQTPSPGHYFERGPVAPEERRLHYRQVSDSEEGWALRRAAADDS